MRVQCWYVRWTTMLLLQLSVRATMHHGNVGKVAGRCLTKSVMEIFGACLWDCIRLYSSTIAQAFEHLGTEHILLSWAQCARWNYIPRGENFKPSLT